MKLYPYQLRTVRYLLKNLPRKHSILVQSPVATGKTVVFAECASRWADQGKRVLVLAHREELLFQAKEKLSALGLSVGVVKSGYRHLEDFNAPVQVASVQTLVRRNRAPKPDVIIIDEAHHTPAKSYRKIIKRYPSALLVGFSATPIHGSSHHSLADLFEDLFIAIEPAEAVKRGYIAPWRGRVWVPPDLSRVAIKNGDFEAKALGEAMSSRHIVGDIVKGWKKHAKDKSTIIFAATLSQSEAIVKAFRKAKIAAESLDGDSRLEVRRSMLAKFNVGEFPVLCNVGLFTEGTNIERAKCIILARPTHSVGLFLQMVGRGRRKWNKETCIIHDHGGLFGHHMGPDDSRDWKLGGKSATPRMVKCPKCSEVRPVDVSRCPKGCKFKSHDGVKDPAWILRAYDYDAEQFLEMKRRAIELAKAGKSVKEIVEVLNATG